MFEVVSNNSHAGLASELEGASLRIVVLDHIHVMRQGIRSVLGSMDNVEIVADFSNGSDFLRGVQRLSPDIVVIDPNVPDLSGVELLNALHRDYPNVRVIVYCCQAITEEIQAALRQGVSGYLAKQASAAELRHAVELVAAGDVFVHPLVQRCVMSHPGLNKDAAPSITPRELDVLKRVSLGFNNSRIASDLGLTVGTVKVHVSRLIGKLGASDRTQVVVEAMKRRLVRPPVW